MKIPAPHLLARRRAASGVTLFECLIYISLVAIVLGCATTAFYKCWDAHMAIRRNADDIVQVLHVGERWRADVRAATGQIRFTETNGNERLQIPSSQGEILYTFADGELRRQANSAAPETVLLPFVKSSHMQTNPRQQVTAWRWDVELKTKRKEIRLRPQFTFEAVVANSR